MRANTVRARKRNHIGTATAAATLATLVALATLPTDMAVAGSPREDPFDLVYSVEFERGQITKSSVDDLDPEASYQAEIERKPDHGEDGAGDHGKIQPDLLRLLEKGDPREYVEVVFNYRDDLVLPRFPMPDLDDGRETERNKYLLEEARELVEDIRRRRAPGYEELAQRLARHEGKVIETFWLVRAIHAAVPLGAVEELVAPDDVLYVELADGAARPPADANPDNDVVDARAKISSDPYFNLGQTAGWIGLLDTGVRTTHTMFNAPDHLAIVSDITGAGDPTDQCNHGTASAGLITGNDNLGFNWRGVTAIAVDSWDIYGNDCLVGGTHTVAGFEQAVMWLDKVIVAEIQLNAGETSASSTAADNAFDTGSVVIAANGNYGPNAGTVRSPGNAHKAIGIGAYDLTNGTLMNYSGRGPTADGRYKPDLALPTNIETARSTSNTALGSFGGTSAATPVAGGAAALLRNWQRGGVGSIDPGHVNSHLILGGDDPWPFTNNEGAGRFRLGTGGHAWWGKVGVEHGEVIDIPISVAAGKTKFEGALWWPESASLHNDVDLRLVSPSGAVKALSWSASSVFERATVNEVYAGTWKLRITGYSVSGSQPVYWSARTR